MAEALAIVGFVSSIIQFTDFSTKVIERLDEFQSSVHKVPQLLRDLKTLLSLLRDTLGRMKAEPERSLTSTDTQMAMLEVIEDCRLEVQRLDDILVKTLPKPGESGWKRKIKEISSVGQDREVQKIVDQIQRYLTSLIHHHATLHSLILPTRTKTPLYTVPFAQDPNFTGRQDELDQIEKHFQTQQRVVLAGLGGVGKSQIAIEYCYRFRQSRPQSSVIWVHANIVSRIDQAYKEIAANAHLPGWDDHKRNKLALVAEWLSQDESGQWLIVLDNADDSDVFFNKRHDLLSQEADGKTVADFIPQSAQGRILITTRDHRIGEILTNRVNAINVSSLTAQKARDLFGSLVPQKDIGDESDAKELLESLEHLPLAITQAAAFITENSMTSSRYLEAFRACNKDVKEYLNKKLVDQRQDFEAQSSVIRTWKLSFDHIRKTKPYAVELLAVMSVLDCQGISQDLLCRPDERSIGFNIAIERLQAFSLITTEKGGHQFGIHRLVQLATQHWLRLEGEMQRWREKALKIISEEYPVGIFENWTRCNSLSAQMQVVIGYALDSERCQLYSATLLNKACQYDLTQGRYDGAVSKCTKAYKIRQNLLGKEHPATLSSMTNLASTFCNQGRWTEAEELQVQVMETSSRMLGPEHPDTLGSMANLASTYQNQGRWKEVEELQLQVMETSSRVLGPEHPDTLSSMANLASTFGNQGRWTEAEKLEVQVMETCLRVLGQEHPSTLTSTANLALTYQNQGRWEDAEVLELHVMKALRRVLGPDHPSTLSSMANLASTYRDQGRWTEAEELQTRVTESSSRVLGPEHPATLSSMANLASTFWNQGRWTEAEKLEVQVMKTSSRVLGEEHPDTLASISNLASTYRDQGRWIEAEKIEAQVIETRKRVLGEEHPSTLSSMANLASTYRNQGRWKEAEELEVGVMETRKRVLGEEHPSTLSSMANLASTYRNQGRWKEAEELEVGVMETRKRVLGEEHPDTLTSMNNLAFTWKRQCKNTKAINLMGECVHLRTRILGVNHPDTLSSSAAFTEWQIQEPEGGSSATNNDFH